jgi:hypothetical protein
VLTVLVLLTWMLIIYFLLQGAFVNVAYFEQFGVTLIEVEFETLIFQLQQLPVQFPNYNSYFISVSRLL